MMGSKRMRAVLWVVRERLRDFNRNNPRPWDDTLKKLDEVFAETQVLGDAGPALPCWYCAGRDGDNEEYDPAVHRGWLCEACDERRAWLAREAELLGQIAALKENKP